MPALVTANPAQSRHKPSLRRLLRCRRGSTAVEFALIAAPFLACLIAIFETGIAFYAQAALQTATTQSARLIMTGQAQNQGLTAGQFHQQVCANITALFSCAGIYVNVQKFGSFSSAAVLNPLQNGNFNNNLMKYIPGGPGDIVLVQVFYQWPALVAPLGFNLSNMNGNNRLLVATAAFRNEPYH
jgi:Flp pilus assembly protein TadG